MLPQRGGSGSFAMKRVVRQESAGEYAVILSLQPVFLPEARPGQPPAIAAVRACRPFPWRSRTSLRRADATRQDLAAPAFRRDTEGNSDMSLTRESRHIGNKSAYTASKIGGTLPREAIRTTLCRRAGSFLGLATVASLLLGCAGFPSHFHDEKAAALSVKLQNDFAAYREDQASLYANMAANLDAFQIEEEALLARFAAAFESALTTQVTGLNWNDLDRNLTTVEGELANLESDMLMMMKDDLQRKGVLQSSITTAEVAISTYKKEIQEAEAEAEKWQKSIVQLQDAIAKLPEDLDALKRKVTAKDFTLDLPAELKEKMSLAIADAPGITVRILELGLNLAELKKQRAESDLAALRLRDEMFQEAFVHSRVARVLVSEGGEFSTLAASGPNRGRAVLVNVLRLKAGVGQDPQAVLDATDRMTSRLLALRSYVTARWLVEYQKNLLPVRFARLEHRQSIVLSEKNDRAWQALIGSGVDALVEYHKGGLTAEDIASVIQLAQAVALSIIAA